MKRPSINFGLILDSESRHAVEQELTELPNRPIAQPVVFNNRNGHGSEGGSGGGKRLNQLVRHLRKIRVSPISMISKSSLVADPMQANRSA